MSDLATLITALGSLITALGGAIAVVVTALRTSRRERQEAASEVLDELAAAAEDGVLEPEEIARIRQALRKEQGKRGGGQ